MKKMVNICMCMSLFSLLFVGCGDKSTGKSLLYKVSGNGLEKPSYLFGTHHLSPLSILDEHKSFRKAFEASDVVVGELLMTDMAALQSELQPHMMVPAGFSYREALSEEDYNTLDSAMIVNFGSGLDLVYGMMHPAALNSMYTMIIYNNASGEINPMSHVSLDQHLQDTALEAGKEVAALETVDDQVYALFYSETPERQAQALVAMARHPEFYEESIMELNRYYLEKDIDKLYELSFNNPDDPEPMSEEMAYALNKERNDKWLSVMPGMMKAKPTFFAVGALHLAGQEGLVNRLRGMGYTVEPMK